MVAAALGEGRMPLMLVGIGKIAVDSHLPALHGSDAWDGVGTSARRRGSS